MTDPAPVTLRPRPGRGHALARWPVLGVALVTLMAAAWWGLADLMPERDPRSATPGPARTTDMANLEAVEAILETVQQAVRDGAFAKARTLLETAIEQYSRDQALRLALADLYIRMGRPAEESGEITISPEERRALDEQAYEQFVTALEIGPRTPQTEFAAGTLARELGRTDAAIAHFSSAAALDQSSAVYPTHLGQVYFARDELEAAGAQLAVAVSLDPDSATAWGMMAEIALRGGSPRIALQHIEKAVAIEPRELAWRHIQARAFNRVAEPDNAIAALDALADGDRFDPTSLQLAGQAMGLAQRPADALARYERAIEAGTTDLRIYLDAAAWAERVGDKPRAIELARTAAMGDIEGAQRMLERLEGTP